MNLRRAFEDQAATCAHMGSPLMGRVLSILARRWNAASPLGRALAAFDGDIGPAGHSLPLRVGGGLHALVLSNRDADLVAAYPPHEVDETTLEKAVVKALETQQEFMLDWIRTAPQTNEVRRSAALIAMAQVVCARFPRPVVLWELGASGGLNLMWDRYALLARGTRYGPKDAVLHLAPAWTGPTPGATCPQVVDRSGVDVNPLNPNDPDDLLRLNAFLWADQPHRLDLTRRAAAVQNTRIDRGDAIAWLEHRLADMRPGHLHIVQHTVAWQYFPADAQARGTELLERAGARATEDNPLAWMRMETDGDTTGQQGAALTVRMWPGDITLALGRADFHGRWIDWRHEERIGDKFSDA